MKKDKETDARILMAELGRELETVVQKIYKLAFNARRVIPNHPYVLVFVLPKEHVTESGLWLADTSQSKPVYEGLVLETWRPYDEIRQRFRKAHDDMPAIQDDIVIHHECSLKVGDRVFFPHYEGITLFEYDEKYFKMIREGSDQNKFPYMNVLGVADYTGDAKNKKALIDAAKKFYSISTSGASGVSRGANLHEVAR
jgi:co-chaperonin GroES (HSP10)